MKKKPTPFLDFYNECVEMGRLKTRPYSEYGGFTGLCGTEACKDSDIFWQFKPTWEEANEVYWGFNGEIVNPNESWDAVRYEFTPLRQTIVLFCAAINGELES